VTQQRRRQTGPAVAAATAGSRADAPTGSAAAATGVPAPAGSADDQTVPVPVRDSARSTAWERAAASARAPVNRVVPRAGSASTTGTPRTRRARLRLRRVDPWSVLTLSLLTSLFLAIMIVVAVVAVYGVLQAAGVPDSVNSLVAEVTRSPGSTTTPPPLLTAGRALTVAGVLAVVDVVLLTALSTLGAVLYNLVASFTGGVEVTLAEDER
jgi:hypothetical protein